jgi:2-polyprenyl-6-methoxyphenol hydroxylase-like FAD-dependent oxidoreductase
MGSAVVIGAGIGGLTAALALTAEGWDVTVVERAPALGAVGSCIVVGPNALRALDSLPGGIADEVRALAVPPVLGGVRALTGRWLVKQDFRIFLDRYHDPLVTIERPVLIDMLARRLPVGSLRLGAEVASSDADTGEVTLVSGETLRADLVVGADGVHSATRRRLFPGHPDAEFIGVTCRLLLVPGEGLNVTPGEVWGRAAMFGVFPMADGRVYAFTEQPATEPFSGGSMAVEKTLLQTDFGGFPAPIPEIIDRADPAEMLRVDLHAQRKSLRAFHRGRVALLGDAAHAMTPNIGQGACQAMEDAVVLAHHAHDLPAYSAARVARANRMVWFSTMATRLATATGGRAAVRDAALHTSTVFGSALAVSQADGLFGWTPPSDSQSAIGLGGRTPRARINSRS